MIDIIIPVYNVSQYLKKCLDSVLGQTYKDIHIIIVDDGSTDGCASICDTYDNYSNVTVIHQKNAGLSAARNTGLSISNSEYVMFVDSDDWIEPNTVERLYTLVKNNNCDISCCRFIFEYGNKSVCTSPQKGKIVIYTPEKALYELFSKRSIGFAAWGKLYKRELFNDIEFPSGKIHEDIPTTPKLFLRCNHIITTDEALFHYRQQNGSLSRDSYKSSHKDLYIFSVQNKYILNIYPSLKDVYWACYFTTVKDLLTLFKSQKDKIQYWDDYSLYLNEIKKNIIRILKNKRLTIKSKISILSVLFPFRNMIKCMIKK